MWAGYCREGERRFEDEGAAIAIAIEIAGEGAQELPQTAGPEAKHTRPVG